MLSEANNIPPPAPSPDSPLDENIPPSSFIMVTTIVNTITSAAALELSRFYTAARMPKRIRERRSTRALMCSEVMSDGIHTDNEILAPGAVDDPALGVLGSLPGPESLQCDMLNTCQGVEIWFSYSK